MKIVSLIPARKGSKGIKNKNLIDLCGKPLIYYSIQASKKSLVDETWVSSDSDEILDISRNLDALADFLSFSFQGGTDISLALHEAIGQLKREEYKDADVLVISDFIMYKIEKDLVEGMEFTKHHLGTQYHNITLNNQANLEILDLFDNHWVYDPKEKRVVKSAYKDLIKL